MEIQHLLRQIEIIPLEKLGENINIIGAGAIGSFTALALAKMGFGNIGIYDADKIENENMNCQFYPLDAIGKPKAVAIKEMVKAFSGFEIGSKEALYEGAPLPGLIISAVDNMKTRTMIWEAAKKSPTAKMVIDPRMGAEAGLVYVMDPHDEKDVVAYEKTLYSDEEAVQERCTAKATMYSVLLIAGQVAKAVKDIVTGAPYARISHLGIKDNQYHLWPKHLPASSPEAVAA